MMKSGSDALWTLPKWMQPSHSDLEIEELFIWILRTDNFHKSAKFYRCIFCSVERLPELFCIKAAMLSRRLAARQQAGRLAEDAEEIAVKEPYH